MWVLDGEVEVPRVAVEAQLCKTLLQHHFVQRNVVGQIALFELRQVLRLEVGC